MTSELKIRTGSIADAPILIALFDEAVAWLVARGQTGQWGSRPFSARPQGRARVDELSGGGGLRVAELDGVAVGALVVGDAPAYAPPTPSAELYVQLLLTSRRYAGRRIGSRLVQVAAAEARSTGRPVLRVDCWAGAPALVAWYRRQGFRPTSTFDLDGWVGQVFAMAVA